ncbi:hypothetical protein PBI_PEREGRIN_101 [Rhodococcus phage Peregrin]|nr:hypothetical protein PBI_PEREGRIN_101 [Rhodococcus phage Peregrin]
MPNEDEVHEVGLSDMQAGMFELFLGVLAYAIENDEVLNVKKETLSIISQSMIESNSVPELAIDDEGNRIRFAVRLVNQDTYEEVEY